MCLQIRHVEQTLCVYRYGTQIKHFVSTDTSHGTKSVALDTAGRANIMCLHIRYIEETLCGLIYGSHRTLVLADAQVDLTAYRL